MSSDAEIRPPRAAVASATTGAVVVPDPRRWAALVVLLLAAFMNLLDKCIRWANITRPCLTELGRAESCGLGYGWYLGCVVIRQGRYWHGAHDHPPDDRNPRGHQHERSCLSAGRFRGQLGNAIVKLS
jgi:hypothetical protein